MTNPWLTFLKAFRTKHPKLSVTDAAKAASKIYKKTKTKPMKGKGFVPAPPENNDPAYLKMAAKSRDNYNKSLANALAVRNRRMEGKGKKTQKGGEKGYTENVLPWKWKSKPPPMTGKGRFDLAVLKPTGTYAEYRARIKGPEKV